MSVVAKDVKQYQPAELQPAAPLSPMAIMQIALDKDLDMGRVTQLMDIAERWQRGQAEQAFNEAMSSFKEQPPQVFADKVNKQFDSKYSSLGNFVNTVNAALGKYRLEASWEIEQTQSIKVTCVLAHAGGHKRKVTISGPPDTSGSKNPIQQIKSTLTYLELATFQAVTGIAVQGASQDDDGGEAGGAPRITEKQVADLEALISEVKADRAKFLAYLKVQSLGDVLADKYPIAVKALESKRMK